MRWLCAALVLVLGGGVSQLQAISITGYSATVNDRFSSGWPTMPVENASPSFVGDGLDFSGVGWGSGRNSVLVSPRHYLQAAHFTTLASLSLLTSSGGLKSQTAWKVESTGVGLNLSGQYDLALATTNTSVPVAYDIPRYGILDLNASSTSNSPDNYTGLPMLLYGNGSSGPRVAETQVWGASTTSPSSVLITTQANAVLQSGDSGSPALARWTNPNGADEIVVLGNNSAVGTIQGQSGTFNFMNFTGTVQAINALNALMVDDGRVLRVVGNSSLTWTGQSVGSDKFILFDAGATTRRSFNVPILLGTNMRGLYFKTANGSTDGFTFSGSGTLTIGRGGIANYDDDRQTIQANILLGDHQYWIGGAGGITASNINNNGKLLEIRAGDASVIINGSISGAGGLTVDAGLVQLNGINSYTGNTWIPAGELVVNGVIANSGGVLMGSEGVLSGHGTAGKVSGAGTVAPGSSAGILTVESLDLSGGLDFDFEFSLLGLPDFDSAEDSGNDVLRLTSSEPFNGVFTSVNVVRLYLDFAQLPQGFSIYGGFFSLVDYGSTLENAAIEVYQLNAGGDVIHGGKAYSAYAGSESFEIAVVQQTANFGSGEIDGYLMEVSMSVPEGDAAVLIVGMVAVIVIVRFARKRTAAR